MLLHHDLRQSAQRRPEKTAVICGANHYSYGLLHDQAEQIASALLTMGIQRHDRVVIFTDNRIEAVIAFYGILRSGATAVLVDPGIKPRKLAYVLKDSGARLIIADVGPRTKVVRDALQESDLGLGIVWIPDLPQNRPITPKDGPAASREWSWSTLRHADRHPPSGHWPKVVDIDLAAIIYTSGSTGQPKGVMCAHYNMVSAVRSITTYLDNDENDIIFNCLPLSFDYGLYQVLMAFHFGGRVVLEKSFVYPSRAIEKFIETGATGLPLVPTMAAILLRLENIQSYDWRRLRYITNTAAALPPDYIRKLRDCFPHAALFCMYGLTECKRVSYLPPGDIDRKTGSVGIPIPNSEVFIVDEEGRPVSTGTIGELVVRGANVMQGYWNAPEETRRVFQTGRYGLDVQLFTGDLFQMDADGYLYFVSRKDDMIKSKGEKVSPVEIETILCEMEMVAEAAVIGIPDAILGSAIKAFVVPPDSANPDPETIRRHCARHLEPVLVPKEIVICRDLPKTANGKVDKKKLLAE